MKRYQLEVTEEQLRLIANAVEDWHREIIHFLTIERGENNVYSSPTLTCKDSLPLPTIKAIKTIN